MVSLMKPSLAANLNFLQHFMLIHFSASKSSAVISNTNTVTLLIQQNLHYQSKAYNLLYLIIVDHYANYDFYQEYFPASTCEISSVQGLHILTFADLN